MSEPIPQELSDQALQLRATTLGARLAELGLTMATAESCTGGWIAKTFTDVAGSSTWFTGGVVTYSNDAKGALLGVQKTTLKSHGAVSEAVVHQMAQGALEAVGADCAVSVSGVAGPGGGTPRKPVGLVWIAVAIRSEATRAQSSEQASGGGADSSAFAHSVARECHFDGSRDAVRRAAVAAAIELVLQALEST